MKLLKQLMLLLFVSCSLLVQANQEGNTTAIKISEDPINTAKRITIRSDILDRDVSFNLYLPDNYDVAADNHKYPVIVAAGAHGVQFFHTLTGITNHLGKLERMPESIVITMETTASDKVVTNGMWGRETIGPFGDAEAATRHLQEELFPFLETHYRATDYRVIIGVSGSALYPIYTYLKHPGLFDAHLLLTSADMIGMGYEGESNFIEQFHKLRKQQPDIATQLYIGVADWDLNGPNDQKYVHNLDQFRGQLLPLADEQHKFVVDVIPRIRHYEMYMKGVIAGLDMVFPFEKWSAKYRDIIKQPGSPLKNLEQHFQQLGAEYGFDIFPKADRWNSINGLGILAKRQWQANNNDNAREMLNRAIEYYPNSNYLKELQAEFHEHLQQWQLAIDAYKAASELAKQREPEMLAQYHSKITSLEEKLKN